MKMNPPRATMTWVFPDSWTEQYKIYCDKQDVRDFSKSIQQIENSSVMFILLILSDAVGRKTILQFSCVLTLVCMLITTLVEGFIPKMLSLGIAGGSEGIYGAIFIMLIN